MGCISGILLIAGLANYWNVMATGALARKQELDMMESLGMTKRQRRKLLRIERSYYFLLVGGLVAVCQVMCMAISVF